MNSRKTTKIVETITRQLKGNYLKSPPPSYFPILSHPPNPTLVKFLAPRPLQDLPPSTLSSSSSSSLESIKFNEIKKKKLNKKLKGTLTAEEQAYLKFPLPLSIKTRRPPPNKSNFKNNKPLPIVFQEDQIRLQFYRDHPFEAFRPINLVEGELIQEELLPIVKNWTELSQRTTIPTAEDAIAFTVNLQNHFNVPLSTAYATSIQQFRLLRADHENSIRAATLEAKSHGAIFFGEIERGLRVEERVLDGWKNGREIQAKIAASRPGVATSNSGSNSVDVGFLGRSEALLEKESIEEQIEFTGGVNYVKRFSDMMDAFEDDVIVQQEEVKQQLTKEEEIL